MRRCWVQWLSPPSPSNPGETLRWVRRISLLGGVFGLVIAAQFALQGESDLRIAVLLVSALLSASTWVTLKPAIRRADEHGPLSAQELPQAKRRGRRASLFTAALLCIAFPVVGYVLEGIAGAATFFFVGALSVGLDSGSPPAALPIDQADDYCRGRFARTGAALGSGTCLGCSGVPPSA